MKNPIRCSFLAAILAGCATAPKPATQEVDVPVYTPCVRTEPARPIFEVDGLAPDASDGEVLLALARDLPRHLAYELLLLAVVEGCK